LITPGEPIWAAARARAFPRFPAKTVRADVAIVGAGFTGLSAALHILRRRPKSRVVVLEAGRIGDGASGRTTGMLGPGVGQSLVALVKRLGRQRATDLYRATLQAVEDVRRLVKTEHIACDLEMSGQIVIARSRAARGRIANTARTMRDLDLPHETLTDEALGARIHLAPAQNGGSDANGPAGLFLSTAGLLDPGKLLTGLAARVSAMGAILYEGSRVTWIGRSSPVRLQMEAGGGLIADRAIVATAGYTPDLGILRGRVLPVHLQVLVTEPVTTAGWRALGWAGREGMLDARRVFSYFRPTRDGRIVFGGGAPRYRWGGSTKDGSGHAPLERLAADFHSAFPPEAGLKIARGWTGVIGYVADALPAIGPWRGNPNVLHAVGWCGHGVALSLASGAWIAELSESGAPRAPLAWFRSDPPLIPLEPVRWAAFRASVGAMSWMDRRE